MHTRHADRPRLSAHRLFDRSALARLDRRVWSAPGGARRACGSGAVAGCRCSVVLREAEAPRVKSFEFAENGPSPVPLEYRARMFKRTVLAHKVHCLMLGGAILLTRCDPADIESASAAGHLDHMIRSRYLRDAKYSTIFDRCSIEMLQQTRTGVKAGVIVAVHPLANAATGG